MMNLSDLSNLKAVLSLIKSIDNTANIILSPLLIRLHIQR